MTKRRFLVALWILFAVLLSQAQVVIPPPTSAPRPAGVGSGTTRTLRLGITFINSAQIHAPENRYQDAIRLGAGWNRWPLYWNAVEVSPNTFNWAEYDELVTQDIVHGLNINAILLGMPEFRRAGEVPSGLNEPIFSNGGDFASQGATLNPNNGWANFVYQAVMRYKPGGELAKQNGWRAGQGVRVWEIWNEPDLAQFWRGGIDAYARLLKVAYLVAHHADPQAEVMMGGLLYATSDNWLARVLAIYDYDPSAKSHGYFMDMVAIHSYSYPWRTGWLTLYAKDTLRAYGLSKPIWVNESGVSVWNDYPGPTWASSPSGRIGLATAEQQAWFFIQSSAYAFAEGADVVFFHQLYDDCGDQPAGTNFPPHNGELCTEGRICWGNAFGIYRNPRNAVCFSQHPQAGSARPVATAFRLVADVFGTYRHTKNSITRADGFTLITLDRPETQERVRVIFNRRYEENIVELSAESTQARLYALSGNQIITPNERGVYRLTLAPAREMAYDGIEAFDRTAIGGAPLILIESPTGGLGTPPPPISDGTPEPFISTPIAMPTFKPTTAPESDTQAPQPFMIGLPVTSAPVFEVTWGAKDNGEVVKYLIWVKINEGEWQPWLETAQTTASYTGIAGNTYRFAVWAQDSAGNWSDNVTLEPMAVTKVE